MSKLDFFDLNGFENMNILVRKRTIILFINYVHSMILTIKNIIIGD